MQERHYLRFVRANEHRHRAAERALQVGARRWAYGREQWNEGQLQA